MKIQINRQEFLKHLTIGGAFATSSKIMPILENVKIDVANDTVTFTSSDGENTITHFYTLGASQECNGGFVVNYNDFVNYIKLIKYDNVTLDISDKTIIIKHKKGEANFALVDYNSYPDDKHGECHSLEQSFNVDSSYLFDWISKSNNFTSSDELRPIINGVYIYNKDNEVGCCATDTRVLYHNFMTSTTQKECGFVVNKNSIKTLINMCHDVTTISFIIQGRDVVVKSDDTILYIRVIEGNYPNFNSVIPTSHTLSYKVDKLSLLDSLRRLSLTKDEATELIKCGFTTDYLTVESENIGVSKSSIEKIECVGNGDIAIGVKLSNFINSISNINTEKVVFEIIDASKPIVIKNDGEYNDIILIMPMLLN